MALVAILINRVRLYFGVAAAGLSFVPAAALYSLAWLLVLTLLPRRTDDPGAVLPGAVLMGVTLALLHGFSELYLPDRLDRASHLYGVIGTTVSGRPTPAARTEDRANVWMVETVLKRVGHLSEIQGSAPVRR
jgi:hypothetical protein